MAVGGACIDAEGRDEQIALDAQVRGREAECPAARVAGHNRPFDLGGPPEELRRALDVSRAQEIGDRARGHAFGERDDARLEAELLEKREIAAAAAAEAEVGPGDDGLGPDRPQNRIHELLRSQP